jgi:SAM-dependent methyltransferase
MTDHTRPLSESWDLHAYEWIAWARAPEHDSYWTFHRAAFIPLIPSPGRLTLDIGCGEGRVSRDLQALGHRVLGIDRSPAMTRATMAHPTDPAPAVVADATRLPLSSGSVDCAVAFMSLHDIDDMATAVTEIARVLTSGGHLVVAVVHPINSSGQFLGDNADQERPFVITRSYFQSQRRVDTVARDGLTMTFHNQHRPLQEYTEALTDAGFLIEQLCEPTILDPCNAWHRIPMFLNIRATLQHVTSR